MSKTKEIIKTIEGKKWENAIEKAYQKASQKVKVDGFRKGKAPRELFEKKYGKASLWADAADIVLDDVYKEVFDENKELFDELITRPDVSLKTLNEKKVEFKFILTLKPDVKLGKYKGLDVKKEEVKVTKKEIEETIKELQNKYAETVLKEEKIETGDTAIIDYEGFVDDVAFSGGKADNYSLKIGSGTFIPGFEDQLIGHKAGEKVEVKVTFPKDYHAEELKGKEAIFKVKILEVKETKIPQLDKDFFEDLAMDGVNSKETLEKEVKKHITEGKKAQAEDKYMDDLLEEAAKDVVIDIPDVMIEEELDRMLKQYENNLANQGLNLDMFYKFTHSSEKDLKEKMRKEATVRITYRLMLEEIAKVEKIEISNEEAAKEAGKLATAYGMDNDEFLKMFGDLDMVKYDLKMRRAMELLKK